MKRLVFSALGLGALLVSAGCGADRPAAADLAAPRLQRIPFTGVADPRRGSLRIDSGPQALFGQVTEDGNGDPLTAAPDTAQVYGINAAWPPTAPTACGNVVAPGFMAIQVEVRSGFTAQQLRNVYARIGSVTTGHTFCTSTTPATSFAGSGALSPNLGLYLYRPLDVGPAPGSTMSRTVEWDMVLPDNGAFTFSGDLWAEVIPQPPTITTAPAYDVATSTITGTGVGRDKSNLVVTFTWAPDSLATGTDPEAFGVNRPATTDWSWTLDRCNLNASAFDPATCATQATQTLTGPLSTATPVTSTRTFKFGGNGNADDTFWWRATTVHHYLLPGETSVRTTTRSLVFKVIP